MAPRVSANPFFKSRVPDFLKPQHQPLYMLLTKRQRSVIAKECKGKAGKQQTKHFISQPRLGMIDNDLCSAPEPLKAGVATPFKLCVLVAAEHTLDGCPSVTNSGCTMAQAAALPKHCSRSETISSRFEPPCLAKNFKASWQHWLAETLTPTPLSAPPSKEAPPNIIPFLLYCK